MLIFFIIFLPFEKFPLTAGIGNIFTALFLFYKQDGNYFCLLLKLREKYGILDL